MSDKKRTRYFIMNALANYSTEYTGNANLKKYKMKNNLKLK